MTDKVLRRLYNWTMNLAGHRRASWGLAGVSFAESSFFPIPPDVVLIPMILANRAKAFRYAALATVFSVLGGIAGYAIGAFLFDAVGRPLLEFYGALDKFDAFRLGYNEQGAWIVFFFGVTPFPYKVITVASGVTALDPMTFLAASVAARGLRFFLVAALLWRFGEPIRQFIERYLGALTVIFMVCLVGGFVAVRYFL